MTFQQNQKFFERICENGLSYQQYPQRHFFIRHKGDNEMDFGKLPIGFSMALAQNQTAMEVFAAMPQTRKQAVLTQAHNVRSETEMHQLVSDLAKNSAAM